MVNVGDSVKSLRDVNGGQFEPHCFLRKGEITKVVGVYQDYVVCDSYNGFVLTHEEYEKCEENPPYFDRIIKAAKEASEESVYVYYNRGDIEEGMKHIGLRPVKNRSLMEQELIKYFTIDKVSSHLDPEMKMLWDASKLLASVARMNRVKTSLSPIIKKIREPVYDHYSKHLV